MEGKSVIPMDKPFLDQWRIHTMYNTFRTYRYLYSYSLGSLIFFLVCLFSFSGLPRDSCANNAANILNRTERNIQKLTVIFLLINKFFQPLQLPYSTVGHQEPRSKCCTGAYSCYHYEHIIVLPRARERQCSKVSEKVKRGKTKV
jgi:hypothetical protein